MNSTLPEPRVKRRITPLNRRQRQLLITLTLLIGDAVSLVAAFSVAYFMRFILLPYSSNYSVEDYANFILAIVPIWLAIFAVNQLYSDQHLFGGLEEYVRVLYSVSIGTLGVIVIGFLQREELLISRGWLIISWLVSLIIVTLFRFLFRHLVFHLRSQGHLLSAAVIVGANQEGVALAGQLQKTSTSGLYIVGFIDAKTTIGNQIYDVFHVIGDLNNIKVVIEDNRIEEVIIASSALRRKQVLDIFRTIAPITDVNLRLSSGLFEIISTGMRVKELAYVPLIEVNKNRLSGLDAGIKQLMDYILIIIIFLLVWPFLLLIALLIMIDSPGSPFFRRRVMGINGIEFNAFKFRTMYKDGDDLLIDNPELQTVLERDFKLIDDPRITKVGYYLRKYSLDELPQLYNVLLGQMSLVGPRMISPPEMRKYSQWGMNLLTVKPGITGLWQISGRSDLSYDDRIKLDMQYIRNWTLWLDFYIILATIPAVILGKGAY